MKVVVINQPFSDNCTLRNGHWPHWTPDGWCPGRSGQGITIYPTSTGVMVVDRGRDRFQQELDYLLTAAELQVEVLESSEEDLIYLEGTRRQCGDSSPHRPHRISSYPTVRWGTLDVYCPGIDGGELVIGEVHRRGDAQQPSQSRFRVAKRVIS